MNPNQSETKFSIQINSNQSKVGMIRIDSDCKFGLDQSELGLNWVEHLISYWFGFIWIDVSELIGSSRIDFWPFFIKRDTEGFSDWFGMIRIGSDTDIWMNRNSSNWLGMNFNPILFPGHWWGLRLYEIYYLRLDTSPILWILIHLNKLY